jgi:RimJ/RimL family protein N-acetyltransferase
MAHYKKLVGERVYLSPCSWDDFELYHQWAVDYEVTRLTSGGNFNPQKAASLPDRDYHESCMENPNQFTIVELATERAIGRCHFTSEDKVNRNAKIGITIGEKDKWGMGFGTDAMRLLLDFGFNVRNYHMIYLNVYEYNERGIACYEKCGFIKQGAWRDCTNIGGKWFDCYYMDILASEYFKRKGLTPA